MRKIIFLLAVFTIGLLQEFVHLMIADFEKRLPSIAPQEIRFKIDHEVIRTIQGTNLASSQIITSAGTASFGSLPSYDYRAVYNLGSISS